MGERGRNILPDTPWHVGYAKKDEADPRRHKSRCIHNQGDICHCGLAGCFMLKCSGSSHCTSYAESLESWEKYLQDMKTDDDIAKDKAKIYRLNKQLHVSKMLNNCIYLSKYKFYSKMKDCPFCEEKLINYVCKYCGAKFKVVDDFSMDFALENSELGYFIIKK